jgi:hypothetical protein
MNITRTDPSIVSKLLMSFATTKAKGATNNNAIIKPITQTTLAQELMHIGYNNQGNEVVANTSTNQTEVVGSNNQAQYSTSITNEDTIDGIAAKYKGSLTADEIAEKYAKGDDINKEEYCFMIKGISGDKFNTTLCQRSKSLEEQNISRILTSNNIQLNCDEELNISVDCQNKVTVSGLNDTVKLQKIQDALNNEGFQLNSVYQTSSETYKNLSPIAFVISYSLGDVEQYLNKQTNGTISLTDLDLQDGKIVGLTPELDRLLNKDKNAYDILNSEEDFQADRMKYKMTSVLAYIKANGTENLPQMNSTFTYKNGKLTCVEQPDLVKQYPQTMSNAEYQQQATLEMNDPAGYWAAKSANKK